MFSATKLLTIFMVAFFLLGFTILEVSGDLGPRIAAAHKQKTKSESQSYHIQTTNVTKSQTVALSKAYNHS